MIVFNDFALKLMTGPTFRSGAAAAASPAAPTMQRGGLVARTMPQGFGPPVSPGTPAIRLPFVVAPRPPPGPAIPVGIIRPGFMPSATPAAREMTAPPRARAAPPPALRPITAARPPRPAKAAEREPGVSMEQVIAYVTSVLKEQQGVLNELIKRQGVLAAGLDDIVNAVNTQNNAISENEGLVRTLAKNVEANLGDVDKAIRDQGDAISQLAGAIAGTITPRRAQGPAGRWTKEVKATRGNTKGRVVPSAPAQSIVRSSEPTVIDSGPEVEAEFAEFDEYDE